MCCAARSHPSRLCQSIQPADCAMCSFGHRKTHTTRASPLLMGLSNLEQLQATSGGISPSSHTTSHSDALRCMADMAEMINRACLVAGDLNSRPPRPPVDPHRPSQRAGRAPYALGGRACVRPTCTMWCARVRVCVTVGSRRKCARRVMRRNVYF